MPRDAGRRTDEPTALRRVRLARNWTLDDVVEEIDLRTSGGHSGVTPSMRWLCTSTAKMCPTRGADARGVRPTGRHHRGRCRAPRPERPRLRWSVTSRSTFTSRSAASGRPSARARRAIPSRRHGT